MNPSVTLVRLKHPKPHCAPGLFRVYERSLGGSVYLHPGVGRKNLERLCRTIARPPISNQRLNLSECGQVVYELNTRYRDGRTHIVMSPLEMTTSVPSFGHAGAVDHGYSVERYWLAAALHRK